MIVATAGHIDHGKTTLVKALTGVDTDRLPEEKKRGISIDLGFAYWSTPQGQTIGFVDVPGHERFVRNMLAGVCGIGFALLVVAADDGVMPQTLEHLHILDLLEVTRGIAVITKTDRVPAARVEEVEAQLRAVLADTGLRGAAIMTVSAVSGEGVQALRDALAREAQQQGQAARAGAQFRFAIDRAFTVAGSGTVVTGTVFAGEVAPQDRLVLSPSGKEVRVRGIQRDGVSAQKAVAGERCALNLSGIELADVKRGHWVVHPFLQAPAQRLDVRLRVLAGEAQPLGHWTPVHVHLGTRDVTGRVALQRSASLAPGAVGVATLVLDQSIAALHGDRFILRDQSATRTLGGGSVLDPFVGARRWTAQRERQLHALQAGDPSAALQGLLDAAPGGVDALVFRRMFNLTEEALDALAQAQDLVMVPGKPALLLRKDDVLRMRGEVIKALAQFHRDSPREQGIDALKLRRLAGSALAPASFDWLLRWTPDAGGRPPTPVRPEPVEGSARTAGSPMAAGSERILLDGAIVRLASHHSTEGAADLRLWQAAEPALQQAGAAGLQVAQLAAAIRAKELVLKDFLHRKAKEGALVRVGAERFYLRATIDQLAQQAARAAAEAAPQGRFTAAQFRDRAGVGRGLAIEILESMDRLGITQRIGDVRVMRKPANPATSHPTTSNPTTSNSKAHHV